MWRGLHGRARFAELLARAGEPERPHAARYGSERVRGGQRVRRRRRRRGRHRSRRSARGGSRSRSRSGRGPVAAPRSRRWPASCARALGGAVYAEDERPLEEHVLRGAESRAAGRWRWPSPAPRGWWRRAWPRCRASSEVLLGGVIAYADEVKRDLLGVPAETLWLRTAPSRPRPPRAMVGGRAARRSAPTSGVAVTGIDGPGRRQRGQAGRARATSTSRRPRASARTAWSSRARATPCASGLRRRPCSSCGWVRSGTIL